VLLAAAKLCGWYFTGSSALLGAAADSAADVIVSGLNALVIRAAGAPPDAGHPFGHGKVENLGALFQALLLTAVGGAVLTNAVTRGVAAETLQEPVLGLSIAVGSIVAAWFLSRHLEAESRRHESPALAADAAHYASDWIINLGVVAAFVADGLLGWHGTDHVIGALIAAAVLRLAWKTGFNAVNGLLDGRLASEELKLIDDIVRSRGPVVHGYHELMTRRAGPTRFVQLHVELDASLTFREAHHLVETIVHDLERALPNALVTIHADPYPQLPEDEESDPVRGAVAG
jgi:ferrous-iron efflux pump FieF